MSEDTTTRTVPSRSPRIGPARFQEPVTVDDRPRPLVAVASGLALLLLVVGVPVGLVLLGGLPPVPTSLPTREQLTGTIGAEHVMGVLLWVVWLAWLQFTVCVVVELRSALTGVGLPARVPLAGPGQRLARTLVASVVLAITAAGPATALTPSHAGLEPTATVTVSAEVQPAGPDEDGVGSSEADRTDVGAAETGSSAATGPVTYHLGDLQLSAEEGEQLVGSKVYVVRPPEGRYHDNLWDIAERTLGDGRRYVEVFELNKGRTQPDGQELTLARLIQPGWLMVVPEDAVGAERVVAVAEPAPEQPAEPAGPTGPGGQDAPTGETSSDASGSGASTALLGAEGVGAPSTRALVGTGLLAAGLLLAVDQLRRRRRTAEPSSEAVETEVALRVGADPGRAVLLDRSLRGLARRTAETRSDLPAVYAAVVGDDAVTLHLAPAAPDAPHPWRAVDGGRQWVVDAADVDLSSRSGTAPYPGLVSLGRDAEDRDVLIDLEAAQGPVTVVGAPGPALEVATALAAELATNTWSDQLRVTGVGLPEELQALDERRYRAVGSAAEVLPELRRHRSSALGAGVLSGRVRGSGATAWMPEYLVLGYPPASDVVREVLELAATEQRSPLGVVCVGDLPGARWRVEVDEAGSLSVRLLDLQVRANRLSGEQVARVAELLTPAPVETVDDVAAARAHEGATPRPEPVAPPRPLEPAGFAAAPVRVRVLGTPRVLAAGELAPERVALSTELVVHLALHPDGVHPSVLGAELWPHGVTTEVREATVERTRRWLGDDADGVPHLRQRSDGRLHLGPGVVLDWDVVSSLLVRSRAVQAPAQERRFLGAALGMAPEGVFAQRPAGRYTWLARVRLERRARDLLVDAAHRLAVLWWHDEDPAGARDAARAGLRVAPTEELLWRDLLRASAALGGASAVHEVAAELEVALHGVGIAQVSPPTAALLEELVPSRADDALDGA